MEESMISNAETRVIAESSDSTRAHALPESKRARHPSIISSAKFKGVVPQQNGHWGAQIYANHKRIWLGTFKSEKEAAMAYDSAAIRIRSDDSHRNLPRTSTTANEPNFQSRHTTEEILNMIRDGSYKSKFAAFLRTEYILKHSGIGDKDGSLTEMKSHANGWLMFRQLFQKELTPSDVGKLNRLVIPKKYAMKYFPDISESGEESERSDNANDVLLVFYDKSMKLWNFRYCYWKSSQSFVFTRGWNRFVKENQLKADDTISFYLCKCRDKAKVNESFFMIDVNNNGENNGSLFEMSDASYIQMQVALQLQLGQNAINDEDEEKAEAEEESTEQSLKHEGESKAFKLFGARIF